MKKPSLIKQVQEKFTAILCIGEKRHEAKSRGIASQGIYSWGTFKTYMSQACAFVKWAKTSFGCKTLAEARQYVDDYIKHLIDNGYAAPSQKAIACALAKLYNCSSKDFIPTQVRRRADISKSRQKKAVFSESRNQDFVDTCRATGLRRHEIAKLRPENLVYDEATGKPMLINIKGKGGKIRNVPVLCDKVAERISNTPAGQKVFPKIPSRADIHSYRADYCKAIYNLHARPLNGLPDSNTFYLDGEMQNERYYCRKDMDGVILDRRAMLIASQALGHNRISIIAAHYLYDINHLATFKLTSF